MLFGVDECHRLLEMCMDGMLILIFGLQVGNAPLLMPMQVILFASGSHYERPDCWELPLWRGEN